MELSSLKQNKPGIRILIETLLILGLIVILSILLPQLRGLFELIPIVYFLIERHVRKRSLEEIGFKLKSAPKDIKDNLFLIFLVVIVMQFLTLFIAKGLLPDFVAHVQSRIPVLNPNQIVALFLTILVGTFAEEIVYRGLFQERLGWFFGAVSAVILTSLIFSFMHYSPDTFSVVLYDIFTIFIDSLIYSAIYHRTKNIFASWTAHFLADIFGAAALFLFFTR